jgi:DNA-directed RNA polymerase specialized sigma24 family protein
MRKEPPRCFADSAWTVVQPALRAEIKRRVRFRFPRVRSAHADESDVVQDALDAALRSRGLLKRLSPPQRSSWFWVVVSRLSSRAAKKRSKAAGVEPMKRRDANEVMDPTEADPAAGLINNERVEAVRAAIATLPESWRRVLAVRDLHPDDWDAVASECALSNGAARALWYRALAGLRERLLQIDCFRDEEL